MVKKKTGKKMILITVHVTEQQVKALDRLVKLRLYPSRSEAIRTAIRDLIDRYTFNQNNRSDLAGLLIGL